MLGPLLSLIGILLIASLVLLWIALVIGLFLGVPIGQFLLPGSGLTAFLATFNILFVVGIPLLMVSVFIMRVFLKSNFRPKWQFGLWAFWIINVISLSLIGVMGAKEAQYEEQLNISENTYSIPSDTLIVEMDRSPIRNSMINIGNSLSISDDELLAQGVRLYFDKSPSSQLEVVMKNESHGASLSEAKNLAETIDYNYRIEDNKLLLPSHFTIKKGGKWRGQRVRIYIYLPEGMYVERNREASRNVSWVNDDREFDFPWEGYSSHIWKMGPNGMIAPDRINDSKKEYNLSNFSNIRVEGNVELVIKRGRKYKVVLDETDTRGEIEILQSGDRLDITTDSDSREAFRLELTMPELNELWAIESRDIEIRDFAAEKLHIVNEGRGDIKAFADIQHLDVHLTGRNELEIRGEGTQLNAILSDHAKLDADHFTVKKANMELNNRCEATIFATDTLWQKVSNSRLTSRRDPVIIEGN